jgi:hypothetical protein|tara:strand:- start:2227 stop:2424 length:198 start_codon:yes stop_codon:yes gene_type:complete
MNIDKIKLFKSEEEVKHYARVNGYDVAEADAMLAQWNAMDKAEPKGNKKKVATIFPEDDESVEIK